MTLMPIGAFQIALLRGREFVIDDQDVGLERLRQFFQFLDFAVSEQRGRVDDGTHLKYFGHNFGAGAGGQFGKFAKRFGRSRGRRAAAAFEAREDRLLRSAAPVKSSVLNLSDLSLAAAPSRSPSAPPGGRAGLMTCSARAAERRAWSPPSKSHA